MGSLLVGLIILLCSLTCVLLITSITVQGWLDLNEPPTSAIQLISFTAGVLFIIGIILLVEGIASIV
jgi:hypothetical protein